LDPCAKGTLLLHKALTVYKLKISDFISTFTLITIPLSVIYNIYPYNKFYNFQILINI